MIAFPGQPVSVMYTVEDSGALAAAQAGPTYTLYKNGSVVDTTSGSPTVTLTAANPSTGIYRCSFTVPTGWAVTDVVELLADTGTTGAAFVGRWVVMPANLHTLIISASGHIDTVVNLTNSAANGDLTTTMKSSVQTAATAATPTVTLHALAVTAVQDGLASQTSVNTLTQYVDTEVGDIYDRLGDPAGVSIAADIAAVKADAANLSSELALIPKAGQTHRFTQVDTGVLTADIAISEVT